jgi:hypothetical protein
MIRTARAIVNQFKMPLVTKNEYGVFDVMLPSGEVLPAHETLTRALSKTPHPCLVHFPATGEFDLREKTATIQCVLCEGSGERSKWEVCQECDGRCEKLYQDGHDGGGWPHWVSQLCHSCGGAGGADTLQRCGFCEGDGYVECAESSLMAGDTIVEVAA